MGTFFDDEAAGWDDRPGHRDRAQVVAAAVATAVPLHPELTVLEYGAGTGLLGLALADRVGAIDFVDTSGGMVAVLHQRITEAGGQGRLSAQRLDLEREDPPRTSYDLIVAMLALHHVPDTAGITARLAGLLAPGGHLAIAELDAEDGSFHGRHRHDESAPDHVAHKGIDRDALCSLFTANGLVDVHADTVHHIVKETDEGEREFPMYLAVGRRAPRASESPS